MIRRDWDQTDFLEIEGASPVHGATVQKQDVEHQEGLGRGKVVTGHRMNELGKKKNGKRQRAKEKASCGGDRENGKKEKKRRAKKKASVGSDRENGEREKKRRAKEKASCGSDHETQE